MRLVTIRPRGEAGRATTGPEPVFRLAVLLGRDGGAADDRTNAGEALALPLGALADVAASNLPDGLHGFDLATLLAVDPELGAIRDAIATAEPDAVRAVAVPLADVRLGPPSPRPGKVVCVGQNYADHVREQHLEPPKRPVLFAKFANAVIADGEPIRRPAGTDALDLEAELAVVVGRRARRVSEADALGCVAGYTVANDVTARDWQGNKAALAPGETGDGQWLRAKGSDTFLPLGPVFVTADEIRDPQRLRVRSYLWQAADAGRADPDPRRMQDGTTADMIWGVASLLAFVSAVITLEPGDVILTGTPSGVGVFRQPPVFVAPGDVVRVEVERIGTLTNPVTTEEGDAPSGSPAARLIESTARSADQVPQGEDSVTL